MAYVDVYDMCFTVFKEGCQAWALDKTLNTVSVYCLLFVVKIFTFFMDYFATMKVFDKYMQVNTVKTYKSW